MCIPCKSVTKTSWLDTYSIDIDAARKIYDMKKRKQVLKSHTKAIWQEGTSVGIHTSQIVRVPEVKSQSVEVSENTLAKYRSDYRRCIQNTEFEDMDIHDNNEETIKKYLIETTKRLN